MYIKNFYVPVIGNLFVSLVSYFVWFNIPFMPRGLLDLFIVLNGFPDTCMCAE